MENKDIKVIIDTNLWISFLISKNFTALDEIIFARKCKLIFSEELLSEFLEVIKRPKFKNFFSLVEANYLIETISIYAEFHKVISNTEICRDPKDNFLLSLSIDSSADYLITGDKDLLELGKINFTKILTMTEFLKK